MRRHLLPLGLAALLLNPSFAQTFDPVNGGLATSGVVTPGNTEPAAPLTLEKALELALGANPELAAARRELEAIEGTVIQAQVRPNPELATLVEDTRRATRTTTLQLNQTIEPGGKRAARIDAAERGREAARAELNAKRAEIRAAVTAAFFDTLVAQERLRLAQAGVELAQHATDVARRRVLAGKVSPIEETKARVAESGVRVELRLAESELATARKRLAGILGETVPRFERVGGDLDALPPLPSRAELEQRLDAAPALLRARIEVDRRAALAEIERSRRIPDLTVSLGVKRNNELALDQALFGVSIPIPVFDRNQGNLLEALHRADKARDELSTTRIRLANELAQAFERLTTARNELESLKADILPGAQSAYEATIKGFELGKFSFLEVLDAQRTLFAVKSQSLRALAAAHRASAEIERILGETALESTQTPAATQP